MNVAGLVGFGLGLALGVWPGWRLAWHRAQVQIETLRDAHRLAAAARLETGLELDRVGALSRTRLGRLLVIRRRAAELARLLTDLRGCAFPYALSWLERAGELAQQIEGLAAELPLEQTDEGGGEPPPPTAGPRASSTPTWSEGGQV